MVTATPWNRQGVIALGRGVSVDQRSAGPGNPPAFRREREGAIARGELFFHEQSRIEDQVKGLQRELHAAKTLVEERLASAAPSIDQQLRKHLDMDRITDVVYRALERRIRVERERRGW